MAYKGLVIISEIYYGNLFRLINELEGAEKFKFAYTYLTNVNNIQNANVRSVDAYVANISEELASILDNEDVDAANIVPVLSQYVTLLCCSGQLLITPNTFPNLCALITNNDSLYQWVDKFSLDVGSYTILKEMTYAQLSLLEVIGTIFPQQDAHIIIQALLNPLQS